MFQQKVFCPGIVFAKLLSAIFFYANKEFTKLLPSNFAILQQ